MKAKPPAPGPGPTSTPGPTPAPIPSSPPATPRKSRIRPRHLVILGVLAFLGLGAWQFFLRDNPPDPPVPSEISDQEVRQTVEAAREKLLSKRRDGGAWGEYGTILLANLFDKEAVFCFLEAEKRDAKDPRWPYARGLVALKRDPENAVNYLSAAAELAKNDSKKNRQAIMLTLAETLLERGEIDRAEQVFRDNWNPPDPERAEYGLAQIALIRGDSKAAQQHFLAVVRHPCCRRQAASQLAQLARARGDTNAAKQYEADASSLEQDPPWPDPYLDRVVTLQVGYRGMSRRIAILEREDKFEQALELYLAMAKEKRTSKALTGAGVNLARLRRYDEAITLLREAVALEPTDTNAQYTLALVVFTKWERLVVNDPKTPGAAEGFREVVIHAKKTTELKPDHTKAMLFWGLALKYLGEPAAAIEPLSRGITVAPEMFDLHLALGQVQAASGDRIGAIASFNTAKHLQPTDPRPEAELRKLQ